MIYLCFLPELLMLVLYSQQFPLVLVRISSIMFNIIFFANERSTMTEPIESCTVDTQVYFIDNSCMFGIEKL
jgi:hypothetical protein